MARPGLVTRPPLKYTIARVLIDARIYGGTSEIIKEIIGTRDRFSLAVPVPAI